MPPVEEVEERPSEVEEVAQRSSEVEEVAQRLSEVEEVAQRPSRDQAPKAVLWDMDGTLVDTEPYWMATEVALAEEYGAVWTTEDAKHLVGNSLISSGHYIRERTGIPLSAEEIVERLLDGVVARVQHAVPWCPGARELLLALKDAGVPCGLVTMSYQRFVAPILEHLPPETFRVVVTGDQVDRGKPHPEPYLTAAAALGVAPEECVAIEDSPTGATSAAAAGCQVLVVPNHVPVPPGERRTFRRSLDGITVGDLRDLKVLSDRDPTAPDLP